MKQIRPYIIAFFCFVSFIADAQKVYEIDTLYPVHALDDFLYVLEDTTQDLTLDDVIANDDFKALESFGQRLNTGSVYWAILSLNTKQNLKGWYLQFEAPNKSIGGWGRGNREVDIYGFRNEEQVWHKRTGTEYARHERDIKPLWNENRVLLDVNSNDTLTLYIQVKGNQFGLPPFFNLSLRKPGFQDYHPLYESYTFFNKFLSGVFAITLIFYVLLFLYRNQYVHLLFSIWLFFTVITIAINIDVGLINEYFIANFPKLQLGLWVFFSNSTWFVFWFFGREFVGIKDKFPLLDKFILGLTGLIFIETIAYLIIIYTPLVDTYPIFNILHHVSRTLLFLLGVIISLILIFKSDKLATYFGVGAVVGCLSPLIGALWVTGLIKLSFDPFVWGTFIMVIAYSFGMVYRQQLQDIAFKKSQEDLLNVERASIEMQRAMELEKVKSDFFANISHEFRTPLSLISGPLKLAKKDDQSDITISQKTFEIISRNTERLQELIEQLLDLSKIESGIIDLKLSRGGLIKFIKAIAADYENQASQKKISYSIHCPKELESAFYDKDKLHKIIHNLLSNAFKYTPEGRSVNMIVDILQDQLLVKVTDTGPGISSDQIDKIFDRFYRIESNETKGSGIGLALTKELVQLLNGHISVDSQVGKGTTFKVSIPISLKALPKSHQWKDQPKEIKIESNKPPFSVDDKKQDIQTVLVVEDNEDLRSYISEIIKPQYNVLLAEDGIEGEKLALEHLPNIIISDVMMPKRDGYEFTQRIKSNLITSHIPVILLTAKAGQKNKMSGLTLGADAYMTKPFDAEELLVRIDNFIESRNKIWNQFKSMSGSLPNDISLGSIDDQFFQKIQTEIQRNIVNEQFSVEALSQAVGFSRSQLHRKLKAIINKSPNQLIREMRLAKAKSILENKSMSVSETAFAVGFSNLSYFTKAFKTHFGYLPSDLK